MNSFINCCLFLIVIVISINSYCQTTVILQPGAEEGKDAKINNLNLNNPGLAKEFIASSWTLSGDELIVRSLIEFDLSFIPQGSEILASKLFLYSAYPLPSGNHSKLDGSNECLFQRIISPWEEMEVNWDNQPETTEEEMVIFPQSSDEMDDYIINVTDLVQEIVDNPDNSHGFLMRMREEQNFRRLNFASSDYPDSTKHPELMVTYVEDNQLEYKMVLQPDSVKGKDAKVNNFNLNNAGKAKEFIANSWTLGGEKLIARSMVEFDLTTVYENVLVSHAYLHLFVHNPLPSGNHSQLGGSNTSHLYRIIQPWDETTMKWEDQPEFTLENEIVVKPSNSPIEDYIIEVTQLVQDMMDNPEESFGFFFEQENEIDFHRLNFASSDYVEKTKHPKLVVYYLKLYTEIEKNVLNFKIYPNPFAEKLNIDLNGPARIKLFDLMGNIRYDSFKSESHFEINLEKFPSGMYFVIAEKPNGTKTCIRSVKQ